MMQRCFRRLNKDGWMERDFTPFSIIFHSYLDDGRMIIKGCVKWSLVCV